MPKTALAPTRRHAYVLEPARAKYDH